MSVSGNFFDKKREWSKLKDHILMAYLPPYLAKMHQTKMRTTVVDCFAGKGKFDDGEPGSPQIIRESIREQLSKKPSNKIQGVFVESKYAQELAQNIAPREYVEIVDEDYESWIDQFINMWPAESGNLFLYIDPYGIKSLRMRHFEEISKLPLQSVETLVNFNAHGFLREGCRLLKGEILYDVPLEENYEADVSSPDKLDQIAGGPYWREILQRYYQTGDLHSAEEDLADVYCRELKQFFPYVLQIPVKLQMHHIAKYRMIFATQHPDGLLLMADNMNKRWEEYRQANRSQQVLFEMDYPDSKLNPFTNERREFVMDILAERMELKSILVKLLEQFGICYSLSQHINKLKKMEQTGEIIVTREPPTTPKGRLRKGWDYTGKKGYKVFLERGEKKCQQALL